MLNKNCKIFVAGHKGMVGSSICRKLKKKGYRKILVIDRKKLDLLNQDKVYSYLKKKKPNLVIIAAAKVGGILANSKLKEKFLFENLQIQNNLIHGSYLANVKNLIFLGSSCIYPRNSKQPMKEKYLMTGKLEKTNDAYAIAKIAGISMCENYSKSYNLNYKSLMPCNAYGINDNYNPEESHFFPALIKKISDSIRQNKKNINIWGDGTILREVIYADDVADASVFFLKKRTKETIINIGTGTEKSINDYAKIIMKHFGVNLKIIHQKNKLTGTPRKILDVSVAKKYGWKYKTSLKEGISVTIDDYLKKYSFK